MRASASIRWLKLGCFERCFGPPAAEEEAELSLLAVDRAGNAATLDAGAVVYDYERPAALAAQEAVELFRAPWGTAATGYEPATSIRLCAPAEEGKGGWPWCPGSELPALEAGALVTVHAMLSTHLGFISCADAALAGEPFEGDAPLEVPVLGDRRRVCVAATDRAGNPGVPVPVKQVEWVAAPGGYAPGDEAANPNRLLPRRVFTEAADQAADRRVAGARTARAGDGEAVKVSGAGYWTHFRFGGPGRRNGHRMVHDPRTGEVLLWGGARRLCEPECESTAYFSELWAWDGDSWARRGRGEAGEDEPGNRVYQSGMWHPDLGKAVFVGGVRASEVLTGRALRDGWAWDGARWSRWFAEPEDEEVPPGAIKAEWVYDEARRTVLRVAGRPDEGEPIDGRTWAFDGSSWRLAAASLSPDSSDWGLYNEISVAYDRHTRLVFMWAGKVHGPDGAITTQTWFWDGQRWSELPQSGVSPTLEHGESAELVTDRPGARVALFRQQESGMSEVWRLLGDGWVLQQLWGLPAECPPPTLLDTRRGRFVAMASALEVYELADVWWRPRGVADPFGQGAPVGVTRMSPMVYDPLRHRGVLFPDDWGDSPDSDHTWEWDSGFESRPGAVFAVDLFDSGAPEEAELLGVRLEWSGGASGWLEGQPASGAEALLWDRGTWTRVATVDEGAEASGTASTDIYDSAVLERLFVGARSTLRTALVANGRDETGNAKLAVDAVEVRVRYRLPD